VTRVERDAGVWIDGQYVGFLRELKGRLELLPGEHSLLVKLAGYDDLNATFMVEPGERRDYPVLLQPSADAVYPDEQHTAELKIAVVPDRAAVFINGVFVGHVDRFDGRRGARLSPGTYDVRIALPGYEMFETRVTLNEQQTYEIETELARSSVRDQSADLVIDGAPAAAR
jgi:hypothetical protein